MSPTPTRRISGALGARLADERGSLMLALLVTMIAMSLGAVAMGSARMAERAVRRDVAYATVVHAADAGVQHALSVLNQNLPLVSQTTPVPVGDQSFTYAVTAVGGGFEVRSTGTAADGEQRVVVARLEQETRFPYALFTDLTVDFRGANLVDSYSSEAICVVLPACAWAAPYSGAGIVATNNSVWYPGNAQADKTVLFDWEASPDPLRCRENMSACPEAKRETEDERLDLTTAEELAFIEEMEDECNTRPPDYDWEDWEASDDPAVPRVLTPPANFDFDFYCVDNLEFDVNTILAPLGPDLDVRPVVMVVRHSISFASNVGTGPWVNCVGTCEQGSSIQFPRHLQIYSAQPISVQLEPQTRFAGVIYAPRANCQPAMPAAGVEFFGAFVCNSIAQVGGWELHYDRALEGLGTGRYRVAEWREEVVP